MCGPAGDEVETSPVLEVTVSVDQVLLIFVKKYFFSLAQFFPVHFSQAEEFRLALCPPAFQFGKFLRPPKNPLYLDCNSGSLNMDSSVGESEMVKRKGILSRSNPSNVSISGT